MSAPKPKADEKAKTAATESKETESGRPAAKLSYAEQRERDKTVKRAAKKVEEAELAVGAREAELAEIEARIAAGDVSPEVFTAHAEATKAVENAMSVWELSQLELDDLKERYGV